MAREFKLKLNLVGEPEIFALAKDHLIMRFKNEGDCTLAWAGGPWFVVG